ncbi:MAG: trypsin-like peptidase domain-containing protein [Planctomycetota bacterium]|nr:trypsin-like peptidase domain-containing protein [Planctomycetota bacterium]MDA1212240.1 trypsin-like peptidase domain-containing protein [Planctomycetota bacterium]
MNFRSISALMAIFLCLISMGVVTRASEIRKTPLVQAIERSKLAVVNIHSEKTAPQHDILVSTSRTRKVNGMGSGVIFDERGYIVTNFHVVDGVDTLRVTLFDGSTYHAEVVSFDRDHDLAIIKIEADKSFTIMPAGTSSDLMLGETVIAVGNAFGYEHTVTSGIISALGRDVEVTEKQSYRNLIQTDASINPGNSGGPLLNLDGEVIGINVAIRAGAQRIGFAIPIDDARKIMAKLISTKDISRVEHGLVTRDEKQGEARKLVVEKAMSNGPAAQAGLQPGDEILKVEEYEVTDGTDFERALLERKAGEHIALVIRRHGAIESLDLTLAENRSSANAIGVTDTKTIIRANNYDEVQETAWIKLGLRFSELPSSQVRQVTDRYKGGLKVVNVRDDSPAAASGIQVGDILVGLHEWATVKSRDLSYVLTYQSREDVSSLKFYILRDGETLYGHLDIDE